MANISYVTYDADGSLTGAYLQELHPEHADCHIPVSDEQRLGWTAYRANEARDGLELLPLPTPMEPPAPPRHITTLAFRNRFTQGEKVSIEIAAMDDPSASMEQRQQSAAIRVSLADAAVAKFIDLDRADTRAGVQSLEGAGVIGAGRALEILDAPIAPVERP